LYGPLLTLALFLLLFYSLYVGFSPARLVKYAAMLSVPFVGYVIYELVRRSMTRQLWARIGFSIMVVLLALITVNSVLIAYWSPYRLLPNDQPILSEPDGFKWLSTYRNTGLGLVTLTVLVDRLVTLLPAAGGITKDVSQVPYHFNYPERSLLGASYSEDRYMLLNTHDRLQYTELFPRMAPYRFYPSDFDRLDNDSSLDKIYSNRGMEVWYIHAPK
jgi:hypothetical protein